MRMVFLLSCCFSLFVYGAESHQELSTIGVIEVSPVEDLMREHGVLHRILLIYEKLLQQLDHNQPISSSTLAQAAGLVRKFIEDYHEKLEENYVFKECLQAGVQIDLVQTLLQQHHEGRLLTDLLLTKFSDKDLQNPEIQKKIRDTLYCFITMYRPHAAREDTVLFPTFKTLVTTERYNHLGEVFEDQEQALFGKHGFESVVTEVAGIEKELGIYNLAQFTPHEQKKV